MIDTTWSDAMLDLEDMISAACAKANAKGVRDAEIAKELRRIADSLEEEAKRQKPSKRPSRINRRA